MLLKALVVILVLILVYMIFFKKSREKEISGNQQNTKKKKEKIEDIMVECPTCKTFVSKKEGILSSGQYFCSKECLENK